MSGASGLSGAPGSGGAAGIGMGSSGSGTAAGSTNGGATNGGATNGGATNGGATNGGATNGGATNGGATNGGAGTAGTASGGAGTGGAGGGKNCAGNAVSLSANGTGTASDAARARVEIDLMGDLPIGNARRTVEFWAYIKPTDWLGEKNEVYVYGSPSTTTTTNTAFGLDFGTNSVLNMASNHATLNPYTNGSFTIDSTDYLGITSAVSQWVHIAMTWNGTAVQTYINGDLRISKTSAGAALATASSVLTMGCNPPINNCFNGYFDELRVWNVERSAVELKGSYAKSLTGSEAGLVGYWKFDEATGTTAADSATGGGHSAHTGQLLAAVAGQQPTFITPNPPPPILCP